MSLRRLIRAGADINLRTDQGVTPLMAAAGNGHLEAVRRLIAAGADLTLKDAQGKTAEDYAIHKSEIANILRLRRTASER